MLIITRTDENPDNKKQMQMKIGCWFERSNKCKHFFINITYLFKKITSKVILLFVFLFRTIASKKV